MFEKQEIKFLWNLKSKDLSIFRQVLEEMNELIHSKELKISFVAEGGGLCTSVEHLKTNFSTWNNMIAKKMSNLDESLIIKIKEKISMFKQKLNLVSTKIKETAKSEAVEKSLLDAEEEAKSAAVEKSRLDAEEAANLAAIEKSRLEAEEAANLAAIEKSRLEAEEEAKLAAIEKSRLEAEEEAKLAAIEKSRLDAEEEANLAAIEKSRLEAEEEANLAAIEKSRLEAKELSTLATIDQSKIFASIFDWCAREETWTKIEDPAKKSFFFDSDEPERCIGLYMKNSVLATIFSSDLSVQFYSGLRIFEDTVINNFSETRITKHSLIVGDCFIDSNHNLEKIYFNPSKKDKKTVKMFAGAGYHVQTKKVFVIVSTIDIFPPPNKEMKTVKCECFWISEFVTIAQKFYYNLSYDDENFSMLNMRRSLYEDDDSWMSSVKSLLDDYSDTEGSSICILTLPTSKTKVTKKESSDKVRSSNRVILMQHTESVKAREEQKKLKALEAAEQKKKEDQRIKRNEKKIQAQIIAQENREDVLVQRGKLKKQEKDDKKNFQIDKEDVVKELKEFVEAKLSKNQLNKSLIESTIHSSIALALSDSNQQQKVQSVSAVAAVPSQLESSNLTMLKELNEHEFQMKLLSTKVDIAKIDSTTTIQQARINASNTGTYDSLEKTRKRHRSFDRYTSRSTEHRDRSYSYRRFDYDSHHINHSPSPHNSRSRRSLDSRSRDTRLHDSSFSRSSNHHTRYCSSDRHSSQSRSISPEYSREDSVRNRREYRRSRSCSRYRESHRYHHTSSRVDDESVSYRQQQRYRSRSPTCNSDF